MIIAVDLGRKATKQTYLEAWVQVSWDKLNRAISSLSLSEIIAKFEMTPTATKSHTGVSGSEVECSNLTKGTTLSKTLYPLLSSTGSIQEDPFRHD